MGSPDAVRICLAKTPLKLDNRFITRKTQQSLSELLDKYLKKPVLTEQDEKKLIGLVDQKLVNFNANVIELGEFFTKLTVLADEPTIERYYLIRIFGKKDTSWKILFKNPEEKILRFKDNFSRLIKTLKLNAKQKEIFRIIDEKIVRPYKVPHQSQFIKIEKILLKNVKEKISILINNTVINRSKINFEYLTIAAQFTNNWDGDRSNIPNFRYSEKEWQEYLKTVSFFINSKNIEIAAHKTFLYIRSMIKYKFNKRDNHPLIAIRDKEGDCSEAVMIDYEVFQHFHPLNLEVLCVKEQRDKDDHGINLFKFNGFFFITDQRGILKDVNLNALFKKIFKQDPSKLYIKNFDVKYFYEKNYKQPKKKENWILFEQYFNDK